MIRKTQLETLRVIQDYRDQHAFSPTIREMMVPLGIRSTYAMHCRLHWLEVRGLVDRGADGKQRQTRLTAAGLAAIGRVDKLGLETFAAEERIEELWL